MKKLVKIFTLLLLALVIASCDMSGSGTGTPNNNSGSDNYTFLTPYTDQTKLTLDWEGKDFFKDGIGKVDYNRNVDGDTTIFRLNGVNFTTRYLGIDTPESTYRVDPWGFKASRFTKSVLDSATTVVLVSEGERMDGNGRYLAWVWYRTSETSDFRLLNLEIVENAYSIAKAVGTQHADLFIKGEATVRKLGYRIWGEIDKDYDASENGEALTIKEIREQHIGQSLQMAGWDFWKCRHRFCVHPPRREPEIILCRPENIKASFMLCRRHPSSISSC